MDIPEDRLTRFSYDLKASSSGGVVAPKYGQPDFAETIIFEVEVQ